MATMAIETRKTGIDVVGDIPWGTHFCLFYETKEDLLDILIPYCKAGLESDESFQWAVADPLTIEEAKDALKGAVPDFDRYLADSSIEMMPACDCYLHGGAFNLERVAGGWLKKLARASARGYAGVRVTGDTAWLEKKDWKDFYEYEKRLNDIVANQRLAVLCTYPLAACGADEVMDVVRTHQFAVVKRHGSWDVIETAGHKQAKEEIKRLNDELEQRVVERTSQLVQASEALREAQTELAHVNRVTTMGQLAASIAHEISQPLTAVVNSVNAAKRLMACGDHASLMVAREVADEAAGQAMRASEIIRRLRQFVTRDETERRIEELPSMVEEAGALVLSGVAPFLARLNFRFDDRATDVWVNRVQIQQVLVNLIRNAFEAMADQDRREVTLATRLLDNDMIEITVADIGPGIPGDIAGRLFEPFVSSKHDGMGLGLSISRSIIEAHDGQLVAERNPEGGTVFRFTLPSGGVADDDGTNRLRSG